MEHPPSLQPVVLSEVVAVIVGGLVARVAVLFPRPIANVSESLSAQDRQNPDSYSNHFYLLDILE